MRVRLPGALKRRGGAIYLRNLHLMMCAGDAFGNYTCRAVNSKAKTYKVNVHTTSGESFSVGRCCWTIGDGLQSDLVNEAGK